MTTDVKTVWTSCYGRAKSLPAGPMQISISRGTPNWWKPPGGRNLLPEAAPSAELLKACKTGEVAGDAWKDLYREEVEPRLDDIFAGIPDGAVLFCWEADWNDCHRKVLWDLLADTYGVIGGEVPKQDARKRLPLLSQLVLL